jgi:chaperonin GroES
VVVKRLEADSRTSGVIVLPDSAKDKPHEGRVLSVGDGRLRPDGNRSPCQVHEGDRIVFSNWSGTEVKVDGHELLIVREDDILAVLE